MTFPTTHSALDRAIAARGYDNPTAVQTAVLQPEATGRDLLVSAQTGSGKTVAFGLALGPTLLADAERLAPAGDPLALIIAPTRELALQVCRELSWLYGETGARLSTCVGGMDVRAEARQLAAGTHIVVGTPGRLRDHLERGRLKLAGLKAVVLDEADEMLDLGFREDLEFILDATNPERRTLLFSATLPPEIETLAGRYQRDALRIETTHRNEQHADIEYQAHRVVPHDVEHAVVNVLRFHEARAALVFCATREAVNRLNAGLIERGFQSVALSGELSQQERTRALQALRDGRARVLVATDVAARGLDLPDLALVVHAELPNDGATLLHRSGRTGRAGRKGLCVLIVPYNRRRKADAVIGAARLKVTWRPAPSPEQILARDQERFLAAMSEAAPATEEEARIASLLQAARSADEIALTLVRLARAQAPAPEELTPDTGPPPRREFTAGKSERWQNRNRKDDGWRSNKRGEEHGDSGWRRDDRKRAQSSASHAGEATDSAASPAHEPGGATHSEPRYSTFNAEAGERRAPRRRKDDRAMVWFRINIGRERDADPRWLLPLICRAGGVTKSDIGLIKINERDTRFEISAEVADQFDLVARTAKKKEGHISRLGVDAAGERADPIGTSAEETGRAAAARQSPDEGAKHGHAPRDRGKARHTRDQGEAGGWTPQRRKGDKGSGKPAWHGPRSSAAGGARKFKPVKKNRARPQ